MKPIVFVTLAMLFYALGSVLLEQKLAKFNTLTIMICYLGVILPIAIAARHYAPLGPGTIAFPTGVALAVVLGIGVLFFFGDYFYIGAYTNGGDIYSITSIAIMFPVFASIFRLLFVAQAPNFYQISGYLLAAAAVLLIAKGGATTG